MRVAAADVKRLPAGGISRDRQYVYLGENGRWRLRTMQYRFRDGHFVYVDDPVAYDSVR